MIRVFTDLKIETVTWGSKQNIYVYKLDTMGDEQVKAVFMAAKRILSERNKGGRG